MQKVMDSLIASVKTGFNVSVSGKAWKCLPVISSYGCDIPESNDISGVKHGAQHICVWDVWHHRNTFCVPERPLEGMVEICDVHTWRVKGLNNSIIYQWCVGDGAKHFFQSPLLHSSLNSFFLNKVGNMLEKLGLPNKLTQRRVLRIKCWTTTSLSPRNF